MASNGMVRALIIGIPLALLCLLIVWSRFRAGALDDALAEREIRRLRAHEGDDQLASCHQEPRCGPESTHGGIDAPPPATAQQKAAEAFVPFAGLQTLEVAYADDEVCALDGIIHALEPLDHAARRRVLAHIRARYLPAEIEEAPHA